MNWDLLIRSGRVVDGIGMKSFTLAPAKPDDVCLVKDFPADTERYIVDAEGYVASIVNGQVLLENGKHSGVLPGQVLRGGSAEASASPPARGPVGNLAIWRLGDLAGPVKESWIPPARKAP